MPAWMASALRLLAGLGGASQLAGGSQSGLSVSGGRGSGIVDNNPLIPDFIERLLPTTQFGAGGRRRRRRRALTASDRADIAFIAGMISKAAAKDFAVQLAARPR